MHFIFELKATDFNAWGRSTRPKHVAGVEQSKKT
jgi:hypothetical protein